MSVSDIRKSYDKGALNEAELNPDPIKQFRIWLDEALETNILEPTAVALATASAVGRPSLRMVLLKGVRDEGLVFYSNYESRKGKELAANPQAAMTVYWDALERQVRVEGSTKKLPRGDSRDYFKSRPRGSQIGALASPQSQVISGREVLEKKVEDLSGAYGEGEVPLPENWGGYLLRPDLVEFWQGRPSRLHDRLRYKLIEDSWAVERLAP